MSSISLQEAILQTFLRLRSSGFKLGVSEYIAALQAVEGGFGEDPESLAETLRLLWCHSLTEQSLFDTIWQGVRSQLQVQQRPKPSDSGSGRSKSSATVEPFQELPQLPEIPMQQERVSEKPPSELQIGTLPVQAPYLFSSEEGFSTPQAYYPISRRSMAYSWRYLRRPVADGPPDVLDVEATIQQVTRQGFYIAPIYVRRERNHARLVLLLDQNGSMTPFHHFTRDLLETAKQESNLNPDNVQAFYFQNVPAESVYSDAYLTNPISLSRVLGQCDNETSVLIVSDAGAARGYRTRDRIRRTIRFLYQLRQHTNLIAWLNPMSARRWVGSSAEIIAHSIPMFQMDNDGLSNAIDIVRGQPLKPSSSL